MGKTRETRERWHTSELRVLVNFMYDLLKGRFDTELAPLKAWNSFSIQGPQVWSLLTRLVQDRDWDLGACNHSADSCDTKWRKKVRSTLHEVEGITPEKALFIYFRNATKLTQAAVQKITRMYPGYDLTWRDGVLKDYQKKFNLHVETRRAEQESERKRREKDEIARKRREKEEEEEKDPIKKKRMEEQDRLRREENERMMRKKEEIQRKRGKELENDRNGMKENERNKKEEKRERRDMRKVAAVISPPSIKKEKIRRKEKEREVLETTDEEEEEEAPPSVLKKVKQEIHDDEEDEEEEGIDSVSGVPEYSNCDLQMMVNFMYDYMSGRCDKTFMDTQRDLEKKQLGGSIWKYMVRLQKEKGRDRTVSILSPALYTLIWSKCKTKLHEVEGVKPEKVLFIYKGMEVKLSSSAIRRISHEYSTYELNWTKGVLTDFKKKKRVINRVEQEEEEETSTITRMDSRRDFSMRVTPSSSPRRPRKGPVEDDSPERGLRRSPRKKQFSSHPREKDTVVSKEPIDGREKKKETAHVKAAAAASSSVSRSASSKTTTSAETMNQLWEEMGEGTGGKSREKRGLSGASTSVPRKAKITVGGGETVAGVYDEVSTRSGAPTEFQPVKERQEGTASGVAPTRRRATIEEPSEEENADRGTLMGPPEVPQQRTMAASRALLHGRPTPAADVAQLDRPVQQGNTAGRGRGVSVAFRQKSRAGQNALKRAAENARQVEVESSPPVAKQRKKGEEEEATAASMKEMIEKEQEKREKERMEEEKKDTEEKEKVEGVLKKVKTASQWPNLREKKASQAFLLSGEDEVSFGVWDELLEWKNVEERTRKRLSLASTIGEMHNQKDPKPIETTRRELYTKVAGWQMEKAVNRALNDDSLWD